MKYFEPQFVTFFEQLSKNNNKEWFHAHRKDYDQYIKDPFELFMIDLIDNISTKIDADIDLNAKKSIFRINKDIRFSKDKTPYKTHRGAGLAKGGRKSNHPGFYIHMNHEKVMCGGGSYFLDKEQLKAIRTEISYETDQFEQLINNSKFKKYFGEIQGDKNIRIPKEFQETHAIQPLVANKLFYYMSDMPVSLITSDKLMSELMKRYKVGYEINKFLKEALSDVLG